MSLKIKSFQTKELYVGCYFDKCVPHYHVIEGFFHNGIVVKTFHGTHTSKENALSSYYRRVRNIKRSYE